MKFNCVILQCTFQQHYVHSQFFMTTSPHNHSLDPEHCHPNNPRAWSQSLLILPTQPLTIPGLVLSPWTDLPWIFHGSTIIPYMAFLRGGDEVYVIYLFNKQLSIFYVPGHVLGSGNGGIPQLSRSSQCSEGKRHKISK